LIDNLKAELQSHVEVHELDVDINDPRFARAMASRLDEFVRAQAAQATSSSTGGNQ
jgi:uncharacterized protein (UPF0261 family)